MQPLLVTQAGAVVIGISFQNYSCISMEHVTLVNRYRNLQMMLSALIRHQEYVDKFQSVLPMTSCDPGGPVSIPSITRLQVAIEEAWKLGFDKQV